MAKTYDPLLPTDKDKVRLLAQDLPVAAAIFEDSEISGFVAMEVSVLRAAALALDTLASNQVLVLKKIQRLELTTDGPAVAAALREQAKQLRKLDEELDEAVAGEDGMFDIAEQIYNRWGLTDYLWNAEWVD